MVANESLNDGWNDCDKQLEDGSFWSTRHHCRLFKLSNGAIVGQIHYEYWNGNTHVITSYEASEDHVADEFDNPDWNVFEDIVWINNYVNPPKYNNGRITIIYG